MGDQPDEVWVWGGKVDVREDCVLLTGNGGYKCNFCGSKLRSDRFDQLMSHLNNCKEKPKDFDKTSLNKTIRKIRSRCERCHTILDLSGYKKERHLAKYCKGDDKNTKEPRQQESATAKKIKKVEEENKKLKEKIDSKDVEICEKNKEFEEKTNKLNEENKKLKEEMCEFEVMYKEKSQKEFEENNNKLKEEMSKLEEMYKDKCKKVEESQKNIDEEETNKLKEENNKLKEEMNEKFKQFEEMYLDECKKDEKSQKLIADLIRELKQLKLENENIIGEASEAAMLYVRKDKNQKIEIETKAIANDVLANENEELRKIIGEKDKKASKAERLHKHQIKNQMHENERLSNIIAEKENLMREGSKIEKLSNSKIKDKIQIGQGTFGTVIRAKYNNVTIAIKRLDLDDEAAIVEMAIMLKTTTKRNLMHANLVGCDFSRSPPTMSLGMELCDNDLKSILPEIRSCSTELINNIFVGGAEGLVQLSELQILHMDIKPANLLLKDGILKIGDFGIAALGKEGYGVCGTDGYMAPEVILSLEKDIHYDNKESLQNSKITKLGKYSPPVTAFL